MKKFLEIYLGFFIALPIVFCIIIYLVGCFMTWSIIQLDIEWSYVRLYMVMALIASIFLAADEN